MKNVSGGLAERSKAAVLKTVEGLSPPKVRILSPPPYYREAPFLGGFLYVDFFMQAFERDPGFSA